MPTTTKRRPAALPVQPGVAGDAAAPPPVDLAKLIDDFTTRVLARVEERLTQVDAKLAAISSGQPQITPLHSVDPTAGRGIMTPNSERRVDLKGLGQGFTGAGQRVDQKQGQDVLPVVVGQPAARHHDMLIRYPRRFTSGSTVRINPEAIHSERPDGTTLTWGEILRTKVKSNPNGYGTVVRYGYLRTDGQHKYFVNVPGLTSGPPGLNNDGFLDSDLLPYTPPSPYLS